MLSKERSPSRFARRTFTLAKEILRRPLLPQGRLRGPGVYSQQVPSVTHDRHTYFQCPLRSL